ncbi:MAG: hypothetical protein ACXVB4_18980 [Pseudobdellovibrionaceae bacterium]
MRHLLALCALIFSFSAFAASSNVTCVGDADGNQTKWKKIELRTPSSTSQIEENSLKLVFNDGTPAAVLFIRTVDASVEFQLLPMNGNAAKLTFFNPSEVPARFNLSSSTSLNGLQAPLFIQCNKLP